jgi:hypothetical protein
MLSILPTGLGYNLTSGSCKNSFTETPVTLTQLEVSVHPF